MNAMHLAQPESGFKPHSVKPRERFSTTQFKVSIADQLCLMKHSCCDAKLKSLCELLIFLHAIVGELTSESDQSISFLHQFKTDPPAIQA
jgi:hypothetical protein